MIYLLKSIDKFDSYMLMERTHAGEEIFFNYGDWTAEIPTNFANPSIENAHYSKGKPVNWWRTAYFDCVDAILIVRRKTREGYLQWLNEHPELLI